MWPNSAAARLILARRAGRGADRDGLRPRRRRHQRRSGRADLRRQGPAELQSADRPRPRPRGRASGSASSTRPRWRWPTAHWPGPLTLVVPLRADSGGSPRWSPPASPTIGLRVPAHPAMQALLARDPASARRAVGQCQRHDQPDPRRACAAQPGRPDPADPRRRRRASAAIESTIIAATGGPLRLLRPGPIDNRRGAGPGRDGPSRSAGACSPAIMRRRSRCGSMRQAPSPTNI